MQIIFTARGETNIDFWFQYFRYFFHDPLTLPGPTQNNFISLQAFLAKKSPETWESFEWKPGKALG